MVFLKGKFFPGGQEKERGTFLSPTSWRSRLSAHTGAPAPPNLQANHFGAASASLLCLLLILKADIELNYEFNIYKTLIFSKT